MTPPRSPLGPLLGSRRTVPLTIERIGLVPEPCQGDWIRDVLTEWGTCGRLAMSDDHAIGCILWAPPAYIPGAEAFPTAPVSSDAVLMQAVYVDPASRRGGIGRLLVQTMAADLVKRGGVRAIECFADAGRNPRERVPVGFCEGVGFKTQRAHGTTPRMRMDLRSALTWRDEVEQALERLLGAVRPVVQPKASPPPAQRTVSR